MTRDIVSPDHLAVVRYEFQRLLNGVFSMLLALQVCTALPSSEIDRVEVMGAKFNLARTNEVRELAILVDVALDEAAVREREWEREVRRPLKSRLGELTQVELLEYHHPPAGVFTKKQKRGLEAIADRLVGLSGVKPPENAHRLRQEIAELAAAVENDRKSPFPKVGMSSVVMVLDQLQNTVGNGDQPAININNCNKPECRCPTTKSSFWEPRAIHANTDLYAGYGRLELPRWSEMVWEYRKPKTSRGANPGFEIRSGPYQAKVKFAEVHSEPFAARVFHAMGYHVDTADYVPGIKMRYDRRLFLEFNVRRELNMHLTFIGLVSLGSVNMQGTHDPFRYVCEVKLNDGSLLDADTFRARLIPNKQFNDGDAQLVPGDFDRSFEETIDWIRTVPANFQLEFDHVKSLGPWRFDELGHDDLREVRAVGLLAAWLGWFDTRFDNTRLRLVDGEVRHYFSDVGGGLGRAGAAFNWNPESVNEFTWTFTKPAIVRGKGKMTTPFRVVNFHTIVDNEAFKAMTTDDAIWMARRIGKLTREQIESALVASGYCPAEVLLYSEKLLSRRNRMIEDLGLESEFEPLSRRYSGENFYAESNDLEMRTNRFLREESECCSVSIRGGLLAAERSTVEEVVLD